MNDELAFMLRWREYKDSTWNTSHPMKWDIIVLYFHECKDCHYEVLVVDAKTDETIVSSLVENKIKFDKTIAEMELI